MVLFIPKVSIKGVTGILEVIFQQSQREHEQKEGEKMGSERQDRKGSEQGSSPGAASSAARSHDVWGNTHPMAQIPSMLSAEKLRWVVRYRENYATAGQKKRK